MNTLLLALALNAAPMSPEQFLNQIQTARQSGDLSAAARLADSCVTANPSSLACLREGGLVWLRLAETTSNDGAQNKAVTYFRRYLQLAPANDRFAEKAKSIVEHAK